MGMIGFVLHEQLSANSSPATVQSILQSCVEERFRVCTTGSILLVVEANWAQEAEGYGVVGVSYSFLCTLVQNLAMALVHNGAGSSAHGWWLRCIYCI